MRGVPPCWRGVPHCSSLLVVRELRGASCRELANLSSRGLKYVALDDDTGDRPLPGGVASMATY
jgi:hypothetical protein